MSHFFKASELVELAILIERNGEEFYSSLKKSTQNENAREVFSYLAGEEKKHIAIFQNLLQPLEKYQPIESYPGEYEGYTKAMADSHVFTKKDTGKDLAQKIKTPLEAIDVAMRFEKDSILFFESMRQFIPNAEHKTVDELINEERDHIVKLKELKEIMEKEE